MRITQTPPGTTAAGDAKVRGATSRQRPGTLQSPGMGSEAPPSCSLIVPPGKERGKPQPTGLWPSAFRKEKKTPAGGAGVFARGCIRGGRSGDTEFTALDVHGGVERVPEG